LASVFHIIGEETRQPVEDPVAKVIQTGKVVGLANHTILVGRDGRETFIENNGAPIKRAAGDIHGVVLVFRDCTVQKRAKAALRESRALYHSLVEQMPAGLFRKDAAGRYVFMNSLCCEFGGWKPEDVLGKTAEEFGRDILEECPPQLDQNTIRQLADQGREHHMAIMQTGRPVEIDAERPLPDGSRHYFRIVKTPVRDAGGRIIGSQGIVFDVTELKRAGQALQESENKFHAVFENGRDAIFIHDLEGRFLDVNREACDRLNFTRDEMLGLKTQDISAPDQALREPERIAQLIRIRHQLSVTAHRRRDGTFVPVEINSQMIRLGGRDLVLSVCRDLTERQRADARQKSLEDQLRQSQKMEAIGQLAGGVAHDFNNILGVIQIQTDLFKLAGNPSPAHRDFATEICRAAERAANLTRQLLLFSRRQALQPRDLDLNELVSSLAQMLRRILGEDIQMQLNLWRGPVFIHADQGMIDQILMNLAVNARDAMPKGGQLVISTTAIEFDRPTASQSPPARAGSFARLSVSDTGCGIHKAMLSRIFEPFFTTKDVGKGTGLGLATVYGIVEQHQGWIQVQSEIGVGTVFHVHLPRLPQAVGPAGVPQVAEPLRGGTETILLVEDDLALRNLVGSVLLHLGYCVLDAPDGISALGIWNKHRDQIDLLLTDMVMPGGLSGRELAQRIFRDNPRLKVVYMSGYSPEKANKDLTLREGVNFVRKPFRGHVLAQTVRASLDG
jgi:two-component system, cell cycle sensor histidine kinase and response regulator CckA